MSWGMSEAGGHRFRYPMDWRGSQYMIKCFHDLSRMIKSATLIFQHNVEDLKNFKVDNIVLHVVSS